MLAKWPNPGMSQKQNDALQIPLHAKYHVGDYGIDSAMSVMEWEKTFYKQADLLDRLSLDLGYDLWEYAKWLDSLT